MDYEFDFETELPEDMLELLIGLGKDMGIDPISSDAMESYFLPFGSSFLETKGKDRDILREQSKEILK